MKYLSKNMMSDLNRIADKPDGVEIIHFNVNTAAALVARGAATFERRPDTTYVQITDEGKKLHHWANNAHFYAFKDARTTTKRLKYGKH